MDECQAHRNILSVGGKKGYLQKTVLLITEKKEEEVPAKLLDDLFRKTKVTPCIYWLPLTEAQVRLTLQGFVLALKLPEKTTTTKKKKKTDNKIYMPMHRNT